MRAHHTASPDHLGRRHSAPPSANPVVWMMLNALVAAGALILALTLPQPLVLPALSILFVAVGFGAASGLYLRGYRLQGGHGGWEVSGLLVFLGFAAAILADVPEALTALEQLSTGLATASAN
jgi:hypothetical protein